MDQPWGYTLGDGPPFRGLAEIERHFGVRFRLFGGAASRLAMTLHFHRAVPELIDLCPFSSDIDLEHDGPDELNARLLEAIDLVVPAAGWCRWSLVGRKAAAELQARRRTSLRVPLRTFVFETARPVAVPDDAIADLQSRRVRLRPNPAFRRSRAHIAGQDLELFAGLLALNAAADLQEVGGEPAVLDEAQLRLLAQRFVSNSDMRRMRRHPRLQRRFRYLATPALVRGAVSEGPAAALVGLGTTGLTEPLAALEDGRAVMLSAAIGDNSFRAPLTVDLPSGERALLGASSDLQSFDYEIDPVFDLTGVSGGFELAAGHAPSSGVAPGGAPREFIHLAWIEPTRADSLSTAFVFPDPDHREARPTLAVGASFRNGVHWLRVDVGPLLSVAGAAKIRLGVLGGSRGRRDGEPEYVPIGPDTPGSELTLEPPDATWLRTETAPSTTSIESSGGALTAIGWSARDKPKVQRLYQGLDGHQYPVEDG